MKTQARQCPVQEKIGMHITLTTNTVLFTLHVARKMAFRLLMCAFFYYLEVTSHSSGLTLWEGKGSIWDSLHTTGNDGLYWWDWFTLSTSLYFFVLFFASERSKSWQNPTALWIETSYGLPFPLDDHSIIFLRLLDGLFWWLSECVWYEEKWVLDSLSFSVMSFVSTLWLRTFKSIRFWAFFHHFSSEEQMIN